jgi:hypothetical protein
MLLLAGLLFLQLQFAACELQVVSLEISPSGVFVAEGSPENVGAVVMARNLSGETVPCTVEITVEDEYGNPMPIGTLSATASVGAVPVLFDSSAPANLFFSVDDSWPPANYAVYAKAYDAGGNLQDAKVKYLNVSVKKAAITVPELGLLLLPLIAFSVIAAIFFSARKSKS